MKNDVKDNWRDDAEPTVRQGAVYLPMWIIGLLGLFIWWGFNYVDAHGGDYQQLVYEPYHSTNELYGFIPKDETQAAMKLGAIKYKALCEGCHQPHGGGNAGQAPPLAGSEWVLAPGPNRIIRIPQLGLTGPIPVKGQVWNLTMFPVAAGGALNDEELAAVLTYIRRSWGNKASAVTPEQVAKVRAELKAKDRTTPTTAPELQTLSEEVK